MSLSKFNGKITLSATNLADTSAGAKTSWNATFSFVDNSGVYLGSQVAVGDIIALDTGGVDIGTITVYTITSVVTSSFNSFRVVMSYVTANANPGGAPDISAAVGLPGLVSRRSALKSLATLPNSSIQLLPEAFAVQMTNNNMFDVVDSLSSGTATAIAGGLAGQIHYQSAVGVTGFSAVGTAGQLFVSGGTGAPTWTTAALLTVGTAAASTNLSGGTAGAVLYQSALNTTGFSAAGTAGQVLVSGGTGAPTWINTSSLSISSVSNVAGGVAGAVPYQSAVGVTGFSVAGTSGQFLTSGGTGAPTWTTPSAATVGTASKLAGGVAGAVVYQSAVGTTGFTAAGTAGQILTSAGAGVPTWTTASTLTVSSASSATNLTGGVAGAVHYQSAVGVTGFSAAGTAGQILVSGGATAPTWINQSALSISTVSNIAGGVAGAVPYQSAVGTTGFTAAGTAGQILTSAGAGSPTWTTASTLTVSSATTATKLAGGVAGAVVYQSAVGTTGFTAAGTAGQILTSAGAGIPTWTTASTLTVSSASSATTATNLAGGVAGAVHYQSAVGTTGFSAAGTSGQFLTSAGAAAPTWTTPSAATVGTATTATKLSGGVAGAVVYQSAVGTTGFTAAGTAGQVLTSAGAGTPTWTTVSATTATTQAYGDNTTNIATTAFVDRLRSSPVSTSTTAVLADRGNTIKSAVAVTIPASVFAAGDCFSVYNNSAANITLTSGAGLTLWLVGTATTGNRTLAQRGIATVYYVSATEAVITGGGLA